MASEAVQCSPFLSRADRMNAEANYLFGLVDEDGSGSIDKDELRIMIEHTGQQVKDEELEIIMKVLDIDDSGEVDEYEFSTWFLDESDKWLARRRAREGDHFNDRILLTRESMRFQPNIKRVIDQFWVLVDADGNGEIDIDEYTELSLHLQQAMFEKDAKLRKKRFFNEKEALENARKEWQMDCQGYEFLNYTRFQLCFFQIADAWAKSHTDVESYISVLTNLLKKTSFLSNDGVRKWRWEREVEEKPFSPKVADAVEQKQEERQIKIAKEVKREKSSAKKTQIVSKAEKQEKIIAIELTTLEPVVHKKVPAKVRAAKVRAANVVVEDDYNPFVPTRERGALYNENSNTEKKRFLKRGDHQVEKKVVKVLDRSAVYQTEDSDSSEPEAEQLGVGSNNLNRARDLRPKYEWRPDESLFSPKSGHTSGLTCGSNVSASIHPKIDEEAFGNCAQLKTRLIGENANVAAMEKTNAATYYREHLVKHIVMKREQVSSKREREGGDNRDRDEETDKRRHR